MEARRSLRGQKKLRYMKLQIENQEEYIASLEKEMQRMKGRFWGTKHFLNDLLDVLCQEEEEDDPEHVVNDMKGLVRRAQLEEAAPWIGYGDYYPV